jgi:hypothetical protein
MQVEEEPEPMFYVNILLKEEEEKEDGGSQAAGDNVQGKGMGPVKKWVETKGKCTLKQC